MQIFIILNLNLQRQYNIFFKLITWFYKWEKKFLASWGKIVFSRWILFFKILWVNVAWREAIYKQDFFFLENIQDSLLIWGSISVNSRRPVWSDSWTCRTHCRRRLLHYIPIKWKSNIGRSRDFSITPGGNIDSPLTSHSVPAY